MDERVRVPRGGQERQLRGPQAPPPGTRTSPAATSSPAGRTWLPSGDLANPHPIPGRLAFSMGTIASAPAGTGAPVAMRTASPPPTVASGRRPIGARPTIVSSTGVLGDAPATSLDRTANPSMADEGKSGMFEEATAVLGQDAAV